MTVTRFHNPARQRGVLMLATLLILLVVSLLGMATVDSSGIEMKMSSNTRQQQQVFEGAEYVLSWVETNLKANGYYTTTQVTNATGCGSTCFTSACTNGYCSFATSGGASSTCVIGNGDPSADSTVWATGSGKYRTLTVPYAGLVARYIIEFRCWAPRDYGTAKSDTNSVHIYRITTLVSAEDGRSRAMLRSTIRGI